MYHHKKTTPHGYKHVLVTGMKYIISRKKKPFNDRKTLKLKLARFGKRKEIPIRKLVSFIDDGGENKKLVNNDTYVCNQCKLLWRKKCKSVNRQEKK